MMKKLLLVALSVISYCSYAEVNTRVYNNYIGLSRPEYAPNSRLIKRQEIISSILKLNQTFSEKLIIESNNEGFITLVTYDSKITNHNNLLNFQSPSSLLDCYIDVTRRTCYFSADSKIIYNKDKNIEKISNGFPNSQFYYYDDKKRLISSNFVASLSVTDYQLSRKFNYDKKNKVNYVVENFSGSKPDGYDKYSIYFYDNYNEQYHHRPLGVIAVTHGEKNKIINYIACSFYNYNEYDDWTKGSCISNGKDIGDITRVIEYWE